MADNQDAPLPEVDPWRSPWPTADLAQPGRTVEGKFALGVSGNPNGRPPASYTDKLNDMKRVALELLSEELTPEAWREICKKQVEKARTGDKFSVEWVTRWLEPGQSTGFQGRITPGGFVITPVTNDYRDSMRALLPSDEDSDDQRE